MTKQRDLFAIANYLNETADSLHCSHYSPRHKRVEPDWAREEIAQLRKWAKMLREET